MKTILNKLIAALFLCFLALSPLQAQTPGADTNNASQLSPELQRQKMEIDKDLEKTRLDNEKDIQKTKLDNEKDVQKTQLDNEKNTDINSSDNRRSMIHDLAWNSWVLFVIAIFFFGYLRDKRRHETIRLMVEKGTPITPEVLQALRKKPGKLRTSYDPQGYLCCGVIATLVAVALIYSFPFGPGRTAGWIVLAVGVAHLILFVIERLFSKGGQA